MGDLRLVLARPEDGYRGAPWAYWFLIAATAAATIRSLIDMFAPDGGASSIAGLDTTVAGGDNLIALFGQWGLEQTRPRHRRRRGAADRWAPGVLFYGGSPSNREADMSNDAALSASFDTTLKGVGNNTGIEIPMEVVEALGAGKRPPLLVNVNGYEYRTTAGVMGGVSMIPVSVAIRKETGLSAGDSIHVSLTIATGSREVEVPGDFAAAMAAVEGARAFFDGLSNSLQRYHVDQINGAKAEDTRRRRVAKAVDLFRNGKQR